MSAAKVGDSGAESLFSRLEAAVHAQIEAIPVPPADAAADDALDE